MAAAQPPLPLPARALGAASTSYSPAPSPPAAAARAAAAARMRQQPGWAGRHGAWQSAAVAAASLRHAGALTAQQPWPSGSEHLQQQRLLARSSSVTGSGGLARRGRLARQQPAAPPPRRQRQRAADLARGLAAGDDEGGDTVADVAQAASSWWHSLSSPYDKEIFLLAIPALFSVLLGALPANRLRLAVRCLQVQTCSAISDSVSPPHLSSLNLRRPHHGHGQHSHHRFKAGHRPTGRRGPLHGGLVLAGRP